MMLSFLALAANPIVSDELMRSLYDFRCEAKNEDGERFAIAGKLVSANAGSITTLRPAAFDVDGPPQIAGKYDAVLIGDVIIVDNTLRALADRTSVNRIIVDRTVFGPGTIMAKSSFKGSTTVYFGRCDPRIEVKKQ